MMDLDNLDQTSEDPGYETAGEEAIENYGDEIDVDNIDQQPVYDGQIREEAIEDPADEADLDLRDQIRVNDP